jgi:hypothetical protein
MRSSLRGSLRTLLPHGVHIAGQVLRSVRSGDQLGPLRRQIVEDERHVKPMPGPDERVPPGELIEIRGGLAMRLRHRPNALMLSRTHSSAAIWSSRPRLAGAPGSSAKPSMPSR